MKKSTSVLLLIIFFTPGLRSQNSLQFNSIDSLYRLAEQNSAVIKTANQQTLLAKWTKIASIGNMINLRSPFSGTWTNNNQLPVSYLPAEAFGGPPGTFRELKMGQQYISNYGFTPQIDIINPAA